MDGKDSPFSLDRVGTWLQNAVSLIVMILYDSMLLLTILHDALWYQNKTFPNTEPDLTCINIRLPEHNIKVKGIYYMIFKVFVDADLNIIDVVSTSNELTILIESKDSEKAFSTINYLKKIVHQ